MYPLVYKLSLFSGSRSNWCNWCLSRLCATQLFIRWRIYSSLLLL